MNKMSTHYSFMLNFTLEDQFSLNTSFIINIGLVFGHNIYILVKMVNVESFFFPECWAWF